MKLVTDTWRQLVQRRLWPVALLLLGALVAVPFLLSKSPEPAPVATAPAAGSAKATAASADPIVAMVSDEGGAGTRRALGTRHNPFAPSGPKKKVKKEKAAKTSDAAQPEQTAAGDAPAGNGGGIPAPTTPPGPAAPTKTIPAYSIDVRFGASSDDELPRRTVERNEALPNEDDPVLVYLGVKNGGKTAVFMVSEGLQATGDGKCTPNDTCETIELQAGETEFFDLEGDDGTQYQLDLVKILKHATKVPATDDASGLGTGSGTTGASVTGATASLKAGQHAVRAHVAKSGPLPYAYDSRSGTLRRR